MKRDEEAIDRDVAAILGLMPEALTPATAPPPATASKRRLWLAGCVGVGAGVLLAASWSVLGRPVQRSAPTTPSSAAYVALDRTPTPPPTLPPRPPVARPPSPVDEVDGARQAATATDPDPLQAGTLAVSTPPQSPVRHTHTKERAVASAGAARRTRRRDRSGEERTSDFTLSDADDGSWRKAEGKFADGRREALRLERLDAIDAIRLLRQK